MDGKAKKFEISELTSYISVVSNDTEAVKNAITLKYMYWPKEELIN